MMMMLVIMGGFYSGFAQKTFIPYAETFEGSFVQGRVVGLDPERQRVVLEDGQVGSGSEHPYTTSARLHLIRGTDSSS